MTAEIQPICPSCGAQLGKVPQRKTKCKACGDFIYNKYTPDNPTRRLMNQAQAAAAEAEWSRRGAIDKLLEDARSVGLDEMVARAAYDAAGGDFKRSSESIFRPLAMSGNRVAVLLMARLDPDDRGAAKMWLRLLQARDLKKARDAGFKSVQLSAGKALRLCPVCAEMNGKIISTDSSAMTVMPDECSCDFPGKLMVSAAIKRADGGVYFDSLTGPEIALSEDMSQTVNLTVSQNGGQRALGYAREDAIARIYSRHTDEFTPEMTDTVKLTVSGNQ